MISNVAHIDMELHHMDVFAAFLKDEVLQAVLLEILDVANGVQSFDEVQDIHSVANNSQGLKQAPKWGNIEIV